MSISIASYQAGGYSVTTPVYAGPLDLLLQLIERAELDITRLSLALVTDQYLAHLHTLQDLEAAEVSAFLVIAARLLQIKSEALLPRPPARVAGEVDPGEALARQLLFYKQFKGIAIFLEKRQQAGLRTYLRLAAPPVVATRPDLGNLDLPDFLAVARSVFALSAQAEMPALSSVVSVPKVTIRQKIEWILDQLIRQGPISFRALLGNSPVRIEILVTFLAMLELVKQRYVRVWQEQLFGEIILSPAIDLQALDPQNSGLIMDLEFDE